MEEVVLPEHLLPLGTVLGQGVSALDLCMVLAKIFRVQYTEVALLRLEEGLLRFVFPEHLRTTGAIPLSSKAVAAHTALSKKAEIFNNFARVKHASIFETIKPGVDDADEPAPPAPIQKLMSVPIMDRDSAVVGVIQISRKGSRSSIRTGFQPRRSARSRSCRGIAGDCSRFAGKLRTFTTEDTEDHRGIPLWSSVSSGVNAFSVSPSQTT